MNKNSKNNPHSFNRDHIVETSENRSKNFNNYSVKPNTQSDSPRPAMTSVVSDDEKKGD